jgi:hypothetical protein
MVGLILDRVILLDASYVRFVIILNVGKEIQAKDRKSALMRVKRDAFVREGEHEICGSATKLPF